MEEGGCEETTYTGKLLKKGEGLVQFADLRRGVRQRRRGWCF